MWHLFALLFSLLLPTMGYTITVTTPTHYYVTSEASKDLIILERKTGIEKRLTFKTDLSHPIQIQGNFGYLSSDKVYKIDLKTHTIVAEFELEDAFNLIIIHGDYAFVKQFYKRFIVVVHLPTFELTQRINVHNYFQSEAPIVVSGNKGYCVYDNGYYVLDLEQPKTEPLHIIAKSSITLCEMKIYGQKAYINDWNANAIHVIDLETHKELRRIQTPPKPRSMLLHGNKLFIHCDSYLDTKPSLGIIDCDTDTHTETIEGVTDLSCLTIDKTRAYASLYFENAAVVLDLFSGKEIKRFSLFGRYPKAIFIHQNIGYICLEDRITRFHTETLEILKNLRIDAQSTASTMVFSGNYAYLMTEKSGVTLYDLQAHTWRVKSSCESTKDLSLAGNRVYVDGKRYDPIPKSGKTIDLLKAIFTPINTDLVCASLFEEDENVIPEILGFLDQDEVDLATDVLCTALSYHNIYARAFLYFALKYKRFGGDKIRGNYGALPKQWMNQHLAFSDPMTISNLCKKYEILEQKVKKRVRRKKK